MTSKSLRRAYDLWMAAEPGPRSTRAYGELERAAIAAGFRGKTKLRAAEVILFAQAALAATDPTPNTEERRP